MHRVQQNINPTDEEWANEEANVLLSLASATVHNKIHYIHDRGAPIMCTNIQATVINYTNIKRLDTKR